MMRTIIFILLFANLSLVAQFSNGIINADRLNVRARPTQTASIICQLKRGQEVKIREEHKDWLKIVIPTNARVWLFNKFIGEDNLLIGDSIYVRSGPGVVYSPLGNLPIKTKIQIISTQGDWSEIKPIQEYLSAWISTQYVTLKEPNEEDAKVQDDDSPKIIFDTLAERKDLVEVISNDENSILNQESQEQKLIESLQQDKDKEIVEIEMEPISGDLANETILNQEIEQKKFIEQITEKIPREEFIFNEIEEINEMEVIDNAEEDDTKIKPILPKNKINKDFPVTVGNFYQQEQEKRKDFVNIIGYIVKIDQKSDFVDCGLAEKQGENYFPFCYLSGFHEEFEEYLDKKIKIEGVQRFIKGWYRPIIYVNSFEVLLEDN